MVKFAAEKITLDILDELRNSIIGSVMYCMTPTEIKSLKKIIIDVINDNLLKKRTFLESSAEQIEIEQ